MAWRRQSREGKEKLWSCGQTFGACSYRKQKQHVSVHLKLEKTDTGTRENEMDHNQYKITHVGCISTKTKKKDSSSDHAVYMNRDTGYIEHSLHSLPSWCHLIFKRKIHSLKEQSEQGKKQQRWEMLANLEAGKQLKEIWHNEDRNPKTETYLSRRISEGNRNVNLTKDPLGIRWRWSWR